MLKEYAGYAQALKPYVQDTAAMVSRMARSGKGVLFEGAQGTLLDLDLGTYPVCHVFAPDCGRRVYRNRRRADAD